MDTAKLTPTVAVGLGAVVAARALRRRNRMDFKDRTVVITGGSRGLGLVLARDRAELERAEQKIASRGAQVLAVPCDTRDRRQAQGAIKRVVDHYGRIDVLVNNAGVIQVGPVEHMSIKDFEDAMAVHMWGPLYTMLATIPHMRRQGGGRIVNIASIGGKIAVPHLLPYAVSKFALVGLSDGMRAELAKDGIRVTTVCPGLMRTGSPPNALFKGRHRDEFAWFVLGDSLPLVSIGARRAARQIFTACRYGDPHLTITTQARVAVALSALFPGLTARVLEVSNRVLPGPTADGGDQLKTGWESQSPLAPSLLTRLTYQAAERNNEYRH